MIKIWYFLIKIYTFLGSKVENSSPVLKTNTNSFQKNSYSNIFLHQIDLVKKDLASLARFWAERAYGEKMIATASQRRMVHLEQRMAHDGHLKGLVDKARLEMTEPSRG